MTSAKPFKPRISYRAAPPTNPFVFTKKAVFMQRMGDAVRAGALHYISGQIELRKLPFLAQKFAGRYHVNLSRIQDMRARQSGDDTARFLAWLDESTGTVQWVLFYYPGKTLCREEAWKNPFDDRIRLTGYELVRITKPGQPKPALTWRYTREQYRSLHDQIVFAIRGRQDAVVEQLIFSLSRSPGFAGIREQVKGLWRILKAEWKRTRSRSEECPAIPPNIGYVRRLPDVGMLWSELMQSATKSTTTKKGAKHGKPTETQDGKARNPAVLVQPKSGRAPQKT